MKAKTRFDTESFIDLTRLETRRFQVREQKQEQG